MFLVSFPIFQNCYESFCGGIPFSKLIGEISTFCNSIEIYITCFGVLKSRKFFYKFQEIYSLQPY